MVFLSVDPGNETGWARWGARGELISCGLTKDGTIPTTGVTRAMIERPQVYRAAQSKGDPNDLITLAIRVGRYKERLIVAGADVVEVWPRDWKGTVDKLIFCNRIVRDLTREEARTVETCVQGLAKGDVHNVIDAVGLGKWGFRTRVWAASTT